MREENKKFFFMFVKYLIAFILLFIILSFVDFGELYEIFSKIQIFWLIPFIVGLIVVQFLNTLIFDSLIFKLCNKKLNLNFLFKANILSFSMGFITPGKIGQFSLLWFLKKKNISYDKSFFIVLFNKFFSLGVLVYILFLSYLFMVLNFSIFIGVLLLSLIIISLSYILLRKLNDINYNKFLKLLLFHKFEKEVDSFSNLIKLVFSDFKYLINLALLISFKWLVATSILLFVFSAFDIKISLILLILVGSVEIIISQIPITINGLGLREGVSYYLYSEFLSVSETQIISILFLATLIRYLVALFFYLYSSKLLIEKYDSNN